MVGSTLGLWIIFCLIVGAIGSNKKIGFFPSFILALILSPIVGVIFAILSKPKLDNTKIVSKTIIRCDGCREVINGTYIAIRPKGTSDRFDYCSNKCRDEYYIKD